MPDEHMADSKDKMDFSRRHHARYPIPDVYRHSIELKVRCGDAFLRASLLNFSRHGVMFYSGTPFEVGSLTECVISAPQFLTKDISFSFRVKYCLAAGGSFEIGAEIETIADATWFEMFTSIHDFIMERKGTVY